MPQMPQIQTSQKAIAHSNRLNGDNGNVESAFTHSGNNDDKLKKQKNPAKIKNTASLEIYIHPDKSKPEHQTPSISIEDSTIDPFLKASLEIYTHPDKSKQEHQTPSIRIDPFSDIGDSRNNVLSLIISASPGKQKRRSYYGFNRFFTTDPDRAYRDALSLRKRITIVLDNICATFRRFDSVPGDSKRSPLPGTSITFLLEVKLPDTVSKEIAIDAIRNSVNENRSLFTFADANRVQEAYHLKEAALWQEHVTMSMLR